MRRDHLGSRLRQVPVPDASRARERTVAGARAASPTRSAAPTRWRRGVALVCTAALLAGGALTAPGRAVAAWVGELVGIGEVGGSPTQQKRGRWEKGAPVVIDNGRAPDGSRYEWVAYACAHDMEEEGIPGLIRGFGLSLEWPGGGEGGGSCEEYESPAAAARKEFSSFGVAPLPSQRKARQPVFYVAGSTGPRVHGVRVRYRDSTGSEHTLPVDFARTKAALLRRARLRHPIGTFVAFIPAAWAARDRLKDCLFVSDPGSDRAIRRQERRCAGRPGGFPRLAPVEAVALGERGQAIGTLKERAFRLRRPPAFEREGTRKRTLRTPHAVSRTVLIEGRAPEGNRYEWIVERFRNRRGRIFSSCETLTWPYLHAGASGHCGPGAPPPTSALSRRYAAKPFGFLESVRPASRYLVLRGYARGRVTRVRVTYPVPGGGRKAAQVNFVRVRGTLQRRVGAAQPFGSFVAFLPPQVRHYYRGRADRLSSARAVEVSAFDRSGRRISLVRHDN